MKPLAITTAIAVFSCSLAFAQTIEITPGDSRASMMGPDSAYTGPAIAEMLFSANESSNLTAAVVTFAPGTRNKRLRRTRP